VTALGTPRRTPRRVVAAWLAAACVTALLLATGCGQSASNDPAGVQGYVALGDSYTSAPLVPESLRARGCFRSTGNYPSVAAGLLDARLVDRSCASATTEAMGTNQRAGILPQLLGVTRLTDLVTVSIGGGNGDLFPKLTGGCASVAHLDPTGAPCRDSLRRKGEDLSALVRQTGVEIEKVIDDVRERAPQARVLLVGYPSIFPAQGSCPDRLPLAPGDVAYAASVMAELDREMRAAAERTGVGFVDVYAATEGHDICAADPWIQGRGNAEDAMAFHPMPREQQVVARLVVDRIR